MKSRTLKFAVGIVLLAELATPFCLAAQHTQYKLIDIGTLGGPASFLTDPGAGPGELVLNNASLLAGKANTAAPDPTCSLNCFAYHAFRWDGGLLSDLGTLPGGTLSEIGSINSRGWISGFSFNGEVDPVTGGFVNHAVLWKSDKMIVRMD